MILTTQGSSNNGLSPMFALHINRLSENVQHQKQQGKADRAGAEGCNNLTDSYFAQHLPTDTPAPGAKKPDPQHSTHNSLGTR